MGRSALASSFVAALEQARQGRLEIQQDGIFEPIYVRAALPDQNGGSLL
jgi:segregation and condensation protein A